MFFVGIIAFGLFIWVVWVFLVDILGIMVDGQLCVGVEGRFYG